MTILEYKNLSIMRNTKGKIPHLPFLLLKEKILKKNYSLSLVFVDKKTATELYREYKQKDEPLDILSFPLEKNSGEIIMNLAQIRTKAKLYDRTYIDHLAFMTIHGMLHLSGHTHYNDTDASLMEKAEEKFYAFYKTLI